MPQSSSNPNAPTEETVLSVHHYTDRLFKFRTTRPPSFRFRSGEFVMIGLPSENGKPILRAYSMASPSWDDALEFFSIKVADGPLTSRLQRIVPGDIVLLGRKPTGTLVLDALTPAKRLYFFSTGTGFAPFASLIREPDTYSKYESVIVTHTCRAEAELAYSIESFQAAKEDPLVGEEASKQLRLFNSCTQSPGFPNQGRITNLLQSGTLFDALGVPALDPSTDRAMICGSMDMIKDMKALLIDFGFEEGSNATPGQFVIERAFAG